MTKSFSIIGTRRQSLVALVALALFALLALVSTPLAANAAMQVLHSPVKLISHQKNSTSTNWSGYANTSSTTKFTDVKGTWTQPTATCTSRETSYSSFWVGIDGDTTNSVEQTGTDADCSNGTPTYYAWYEMYPKFPVNLSTSTY